MRIKFRLHKKLICILASQCIYFIIIVLYHQINTPFDFLYEHDSNPNPLFNNKIIYRLIYKIFHMIQLGDL